MNDDEAATIPRRTENHPLGVQFSAASVERDCSFLDEGFPGELSVRDVQSLLRDLGVKRDKTSKIIQFKHSAILQHGPAFMSVPDPLSFLFFSG